MNHLVMLLLTVCVMLVVEGSMEEIFKVKRETSLSSMLLKDSTNNVRERERRSTPRQESYLYFDNRSGRAAVLWYRTPSTSRKWTKFMEIKRHATLEMFTYEGDEWVALDKITHKTLEINGDTKYYQPKPNTEKSRAVCILTREDQRDGEDKLKAYIETFVVVDKTVRDKFKSNKEVKRYVKVLFSLTSDLFKHNSLTKHGLDIHIIPSKIHIQRHKLKLDPSKNGDNVYTACRHMNHLEKKESKQFDHKLFLTRSEFGAAGYAVRHAMCSRQSSCSIVSDHGFRSAFLIAHEIAHSLGLRHDDYKQYSRFIMSPYVDALFHDHSWSVQSQFVMAKSIRKYRDVCLANKPAYIQRYQYAGVHYTYQRQCELEFGDDYTSWQPNVWQRARGVDVCAKLKCHMPGELSNWLKNSGSPPLDGTTCGKNKYCLSGKCQKKSTEEIENQILVRAL